MTMTGGALAVASSACCCISGACCAVAELLHSAVLWRAVRSAPGTRRLAVCSAGVPALAGPSDLRQDSSSSDGSRRQHAGAHAQQDRKQWAAVSAGGEGCAPRCHCGDSSSSGNSWEGPSTRGLWPGAAPRGRRRLPHLRQADSEGSDSGGGGSDGGGSGSNGSGSDGSGSCSALSGRSAALAGSWRGPWWWTQAGRGLQAATAAAAATAASAASTSTPQHPASQPYTAYSYATSAQGTDADGGRRRSRTSAGGAQASAGAGASSGPHPHPHPHPRPHPGSEHPDAADLTDLTSPASWYPLARSMRRRVVAHLGPTNSGKTHAALQALKAAPSGLYCGPLRLLACEVADRLAAEGLPCRLVTGQEVRTAVPGAPVGAQREQASQQSSSSSARHGAGGCAAAPDGAANAGPSYYDPYGNDGNGKDAASAGDCAGCEAAYGSGPVRHTACTIEMADVGGGSGGSGGGAILDVAVLDEIQMLGDRLRGWAWTRALLGLAAREIHVAGDPAALPVLRALVAECGDELEVRLYRRLSPLVVQADALGSLGSSQAGDCLVGFSRRSLHGLRREVVRRTGREACLVYGALPPEARRQQAALFNAPSPSSGAAGDGGAAPGAAAASGEETGGAAGTRRADGGADQPRNTSHAADGAAAMGRRAHAPPHTHSEGTAASGSPQSDPGASGFGSEMSASGSGKPGSGAGSRVLVASDAIGMGLNLNIRRVVFTSLHKYDGRAVRPLQASEVRQIAGRAGRFSSAHPSGYVTTLHASDLPALHRALAEAPQPVTQACLLPSSDALAAYSARHPHRPLATSLLAFAAAARLAPSYLYGAYEGAYRIASALRHLDPYGAPQAQARGEGKGAGQSQGSGGDGEAHGRGSAGGELGELSVEELLLFSTAPADMDDPAVATALLRFAELYCDEGRVGHEAIARGPLPREPPRTESELKQLEGLHRTYDLYVWLAYRLPYAFTGRREAEAARARCGALIEETLDGLAVAAVGRRHHQQRPHPYPRQEDQEGQGQEPGGEAWHGAEAGRERYRA